MEWYDLEVLVFATGRYAIGRFGPNGMVVTEFCATPEEAMAYLERHQTRILDALGWE